MGIGLSAQGVNMNRLPGWDKHSYGYHGDDGHSFCSSGSGQPYGPTFTTNDVIGCGVNLIDNTCFYTKNGHNLGTAFADLPSNLYPTVGLQTPGEIVDTNFGQSPFVYDIEDDMRELRARVASTILNYPIPDKQGHWEASLQRYFYNWFSYLWWPRNVFIVIFGKNDCHLFSPSWLLCYGRSICTFHRPRVWRRSCLYQK